MPFLYNLRELAKLIRLILFFYRRIFIPLAIVSFMITVFSISISEKFLVDTLAYTLFTLNAPFHYFIYEIGNPEEYYFYYNLGFSKSLLWIFSMSVSCLITFSLLVIW